MRSDNSVPKVSKKTSVTILLPYVGEDYFFLKNFDMGTLGHICADLREHGISFNIINPNESTDSPLRECLDDLILLTERLSGKQECLKRYLEKSDGLKLTKIFGDLVAQKPFSFNVSHVLYFQPYYKKHIYTYLAILNEIKRQNKDTEIICSGSFFADKATAFLESHKYIDIILGLQQTNEVSLILQGQTKDKISNITFTQDDKIIKRLPKSSAEAVHTIPDYSKLVNKFEIVSIEFVRGCLFNCFFCDYKANHPHFNPKGVSILSKEIANYYKQGARGYWFQGSAINLDEELLRDFCRMLIKEKLVRPWAAPIIPFAMKESTFELMAEAGCVLLRWGIETIDPVMLKRFNKNLTPRSIINGLKYARAAGLNNSMTFMVGIPEEKHEDQQRKMAFIIKYRDLIQSVKIYAFEVRRNAPISRHPEDFNLSIRVDQRDERSLRYDIQGGLDWEAVQVRNQLLLDEFIGFIKRHNIIHDIPEKHFYSLVGKDL